MLLFTQSASIYAVYLPYDLGDGESCSHNLLILLALPRGLEPCFRRERARFNYLIVLAALVPASPRPRVWPARAYLHRGRAAPHLCGPVLQIEEWIAADRDRRIGLGDLAELRPDVALTSIRAHGFRQHANADLELIPTCGDIDSSAHAPCQSKTSHIPLDRGTFLRWLSRWWRGQHEFRVSEF